MPTADDLYRQFQNIRDRVRQAQAARPDYWADYPTYQAAMEQICTQLIGPIVDEANIGENIAHTLLDQPEPAPPPANTHLGGYGGTYAGHGFARDCYLGRNADEALWGPHHGLELLAPCPGRVEAYSFQTPLNTPRDALNAEYYRRRDDLLRDWVCIAPQAALDATASEDEIKAFISVQNMFIAVFWPDTPLQARNGQMVHAIWGGHCKSDIPVGRVETGQRFLTIWDSGVRFENNGIVARAAHVHLCGSATGTLSPNGDIDGFLIAELLGLYVQDVGTVPGPNDYMTGGFIARLPRSQWTGHTIPPIPT